MGFLKKINPDLKANSHKNFSKYIYDYCKENGGKLKVYRNISKGWFNGELMIGYESEWCGVKHYNGNFMRNIRRVGSRERKIVFAFLPNQYEFEDISEEFWSNYIANGLCYLDGHSSYFGKVEDMELIDENTRKCKYCGVVQKRVIKEKVVIEKEEYFENIF